VYSLPGEALVASCMGRIISIEMARKYASILSFGLVLLTTPSRAQSSPTDEAAPKARVHVSSPRPVVLFRKPSGGPTSSAWTRVCDSPCDTDLSIGDTYRIAGAGVSESKEVTLDASPNGAVDVVVDPSNKTGMIIGAGVGGLGGLSLLAGAFYFTFGTVTNASRDDCSTYPERPILFGTSRAECEKQRDTSETLQSIGLVMMGIGAVLGAAGLFVFWRSSKTSLEQRPYVQSAPSAVLREPAWRGLRPARQDGSPAASFPIVFTHAF
jgi:hypothetical protein